MRSIRALILLSTFQMFFLVCGGFAQAVTGKAELKPTTEDSTASGTVLLAETGEGLSVDAVLTGVSPGNHGFHIHEFGDCSDAGAAAGGHYNPTSQPHGYAVTSGPTRAHAGDLGNIVISPDGTGRLNVTLPGVSLTSGPYTVEGRAFILHEKEDDLGQPVGNAGARIACGEIVLTEE